MPDDAFMRMKRASEAGLQSKKAVKIDRLCAPLGARTLDTLIKSQVLYQLS